MVGTARNKGDQHVTISITRILATILATAAFLIFSPSRSVALSGNEWWTWSQPERISYLVGVFEAWEFVARQTENNRKRLDIRDKLRDKSLADGLVAPGVACFKTPGTFKQLLDMVEKYVRDHPDLWGINMSDIVFSFANSYCTKIP